MKYLITGGAGFLGYHQANFLASKGEDVVLLDIAPFNPEEYPEKAVFYNVDVRDRESLEKVFAQHSFDVVIHAAAALPLWKKRDIFTTNVNGTRNVLELSKKYGVERFIFISSTAVYGIPKKHPIYEDDPLSGVGPYGESKIIAEKVCREYEGDMVVTIVRPKTFIGTGRLGVFQILYDWVESGKRIPIIGNGKNRYQLLDVDDLVEAIYLLSKAPAEKANNTFNVGAEKFGTVREDVGALCEFAGTGARVMPTPAWLVKPVLWILEQLKLSPLYKWVYGTADKDSFVSIDRIKQALGWRPRYSNADALIKSYKWYLENKDKIKEEGVTHRVGWKQGVLALIKKFM